MRVACASGHLGYARVVRSLHHSPLRGVEHILHAGDIGWGDVLARLERIAPVTAVSGNVDGFDASGIPMEQTVDLAGHRIAIYHRLYEGGRLTGGMAMLARIRPSLCVYGHTHQPKAEWRDGVLLFNRVPPGPNGFVSRARWDCCCSKMDRSKRSTSSLGDRANDSPRRSGGFFTLHAAGLGYNARGSWTIDRVESFTYSEEEDVC